MDFEMPKSKVYILVDGVIVLRCDGGCSIKNVDVNTWTYIDEGYGDRYNLCQNNYFDKPVANMDGSHNYRYENGTVREATVEEMQAEISSIPVTPTQLDTIEAQVMYTALLTDTLLVEE